MTRETKAFREDRNETKNAVRELMVEAETELQASVALNLSNKITYYSGQIDALKKVMKLI